MAKTFWMLELKAEGHISMVYNTVRQSRLNERVIVHAVIPDVEMMLDFLHGHPNGSPRATIFLVSACKILSLGSLLSRYNAGPWLAGPCYWMAKPDPNAP